MAENKCNFRGADNETACIDVNRILDSCRDKDCFEDTKIFLTGFGQEIINKTSNIKVKDTKVVYTNLAVEPVQFNRGFYAITVRFYTKICFEACLGPGQLQEFEGLGVCEKKIILYGSEGNVNIFKSNPTSDGFCDIPTYDRISTNAPTVVCEVTDPLALSVKVAREHHHCCCCCCDIPGKVLELLGSPIFEDDNCEKNLYVTLGFFSVIRVERPCQYIINAREYTIPDKVCIETNEDDPCSAFAKMSFPVNEFYPPAFRDLHQNHGECGCK